MTNSRRSTKIFKFSAECNFTHEYNWMSIKFLHAEPPESVNTLSSGASGKDEFELRDEIDVHEFGIERTLFLSSKNRQSMSIPGSRATETDWAFSMKLARHHNVVLPELIGFISSLSRSLILVNCT
ncbi:hypothetical protein AYI70_g12252 [Smittium culicis]|uniref:Uncharacterized protein n=1 Tax=Smittium culicis TaxID=133412 RepID=A0A1R1WYB6_9FUNG|nr:hypothetical protein AYI70_g12252 [Smittium culicis]